MFNRETVVSRGQKLLDLHVNSIREPNFRYNNVEHALCNIGFSDSITLLRNISYSSLKSLKLLDFRIMITCFYYYKVDSPRSFCLCKIIFTGRECTFNKTGAATRYGPRNTIFLNNLAVRPILVYYTINSILHHVIVIIVKRIIKSHIGEKKKNTYINLYI